MLRPHTARYTFVDSAGRESGTETINIGPRPGGWLATSRLQLTSPTPLACDIEWHLEPDLATHVLYMATTDHWGDAHTLEAAVTGNGLLATRTGPGGPTQVEMGWGPRVELDHLSACFTTVLMGRRAAGRLPLGEVTTVYIGAEDLIPEPLQQQYREIDGDPSRGPARVERIGNGGAASAVITVLEGGVVRSYERLFELADDWAFTD